MNCSAQSLIEASTCFDCIPRGMQGAVQTMLACEWANGGGCNDPVVVDWLQRIFDGGDPTPSASTIRAVCNFCIALRSAGIMDKMLVVNPIIPDSFLAMRYPLIYQVANGFSPFINNNFVAADLNVNGLVGDATSKYMQTGFAPSVQLASWDSIGMSIYESDETTGIGSECEIGSLNLALAGDPEMSIRTWDPSDANGYAISGSQASVVTSTLVADTPGFYVSNRTALNRIDLWTALGVPNVTLDSSSLVNQAGQLVQSETLWFMGRNTDSGPIIYSGKRVSFVSVQEGLLQGGGFTEIQDLYDAVQDLRIALGGGFV